MQRTAIESHGLATIGEACPGLRTMRQVLRLLEATDETARSFVALYGAAAIAKTAIAAWADCCRDKGLR